MKIKRNYKPRMTLEKFSNEHGLTMIINERPNSRIYRIYCHFEMVEVKDGIGLILEYGDGMTEREAIENYCKRISGKIIVHDATSPSRRQILVPELIPEWSEQQQ